MGHWSCLPHVAVRRTHVGYREYSRYCEFLHEHPEYRKSMLSALTAESRKARSTVGLPSGTPRPGRVATWHDIPRGAVPGTVLGVRACAGGVPGASSAAGPVPFVAAGERAARQRSAGVSAPRRVECASEYSEYPGWPPRHMIVIRRALVWVALGTPSVLRARRWGTRGTHTG